MNLFSSAKMALTGVFRRCQVAQLVQFSKISLNFLTERNLKNVKSSSVFNTLHCKSLCTKRPGSQPQSRNFDPDAIPKKKKPLTSPEITLILPEEDIMSVTLEHAEKLSKRRNLKLIKIIDFDTKTEKPVFRLMTNKQFLEEDIKIKKDKKREKDSTTKDTKLYLISSKINENDIFIKTKQMIKGLKKTHPIKVYISHDGNPTKAEEVAECIVNELKEATANCKRMTKGPSIRLHFYPFIGENSESKETQKNEKNKDNNKTKKEQANVSANT